MSRLPGVIKTIFYVFKVFPFANLTTEKIVIMIFQKILWLHVGALNLVSGYRLVRSSLTTN